MTDTPPGKKPLSPWQLTPARIVLLVMGALLVLITASSLLGGLDNYQNLRDASQAAKEQPAPAN